MKAKPIYEVTGNFDVSKAIIIKAKLIKKLGNDFHIIILSDKNIKEIKTKIIYPDNFIINSAWVNICKIGEEITEHDHIGVTAFSGILYLTDGKNI